MVIAPATMARLTNATVCGSGIPFGTAKTSPGLTATTLRASDFSKFVWKPVSVKKAQAFVFPDAELLFDQYYRCSTLEK
jgi:hypothetical protein